MPFPYSKIQFVHFQSIDKPTFDSNQSNEFRGLNCEKCSIFHCKSFAFCNTIYVYLNRMCTMCKVVVCLFQLPAAKILISILFQKREPIFYNIKN